MKIRICQMSDQHSAPLTFRICRDNSTITYYQQLHTPLKTYTSSNMNHYIKTSEYHDDYGNFLFTGTL